MTEHSPLPWEPSELASGIIDDTGKGIVICNSTDAAHIVKCVNAFPDLVKALEEAKAALTKIRACSIAGAYEGYGKPELWSEDLFRSHGDVAASLKTIDRLLSDVKGAPDHG